MHRDDLRRDPFFQEFGLRVPGEAWPGFTEEQVFAGRPAFGARYRGAHPVDQRLSLPVPFRRLRLLKSWLDIDLVPGHSLGYWGILTGRARETFR